MNKQRSKLKLSILIYEKGLGCNLYECWPIFGSYKTHIITFVGRERGGILIKKMKDKEKDKILKIIVNNLQET